MIQQIKEDVQVAIDKDPAARNFFEVLVCYPGVHALIIYRISHWLWSHGLKFVGRILSYLARWVTGIEIHPAAKIGHRFFIDHGMGVVIGETSEIGDNVFMYHGVTLGGLSMKKGKRHPTIEDNVMLGAGAQVLGPITVGKNTKIGSGSVVVESVPEYSTVIGVPGRIVFSGISADHENEQGLQNFPDPMGRAIECMLEKLPKMEREIRALKDAVGDKNDSSALYRNTSMKKASGDRI